MITVDNRRTMCEHCSLRTDLPGFIDRDHAQSNIDRIQSGEIFKCHVDFVPGQPTKRCLGAATFAKAQLLNEPAKNLPEVYASAEDYVQAQQGGRKTNDWLLKHADAWLDSRDNQRYGWWERSQAGTWHYLLTTLAENDASSVYLFFDQCQQAYGPLFKVDQT